VAPVADSIRPEVEIFCKGNLQQFQQQQQQEQYLSVKNNVQQL